MMIDIGERLLADILAARQEAAQKMGDALRSIDKYAAELGQAINAAHTAAEVAVEARMMMFRGDVGGVSIAPSPAPEKQEEDHGQAHEN
jgi:hypothetical protein